MADFTRESGNSTKGVELIAVIRPDRVAYKKDDKGEPTSEPAAQYVDIMVNNSALKKADIQAGKGQSLPNLYTQKSSYVDAETGEEKTGYRHEIRMSPSQVEAITNIGKSKSLEKDGVLYVPFKADLMRLTETVKDENGNAVMKEDGKPAKRAVGYLPNTQTLQPTELGNLTQNRLDKHFANTSAVNAVRTAKNEASKNAKLSEAARNAPEAAADDKSVALETPF